MDPEREIFKGGKEPSWMPRTRGVLKSTIFPSPKLHLVIIFCFSLRIIETKLKKFSLFEKTQLTTLIFWIFKDGNYVIVLAN